MYCDESRIEFGDGGEDVAVDFGTPYEIAKALLDMLIDALNENEKLKAENADLKGVVALVQKVLEDMQRPF